MGAAMGAWKDLNKLLNPFTINVFQAFLLENARQ